MKPIRTLKVGVSGIRGVVGDSLKPLLLCRFARAFATYSGGSTILIGRDTRTSGEMVKNAVLAGLLSSGCRVIDVDICPVPTIQNAVRHTHCKGGIAITASHNPVQWNALKFIKSDGSFLNPHEAEELLNLYHQQDFRTAVSSELQPPETYSGAIDDHLRKILERMQPAREPQLRVAIDCCNGAGSLMTARLLELLGCETLPLYCVPDGRFPRPPEPVPANLSKLCQMVEESGADVGFAQDADADRLAVVSEKGQAIGEEYTLALCARAVLSREKGPVVVNLSTSRMIDDIAAAYGCPVYRTRIGEVNVTETMCELGAILGGEGNGGVIYPKVNLARDSFVAITLLVELLRSSEKTLSQLVEEIPSYVMIKRSYEIHPHLIPALIAHLSDQYKEEDLDLRDGIKIIRPRSWVHVRGSNTEPIVRLVVEGPDSATVSMLRDEFEGLIRHFL